MTAYLTPEPIAVSPPIVVSFNTIVLPCFESVGNTHTFYNSRDCEKVIILFDLLNIVGILSLIV